MNNKERNSLQKEIVDSIPSGKSGRLLLSPRVGKSKIAISVIKRDQPQSILWVTPSTELAEKDIPEEFVKWRAKSYLNKLETVTWMSLHKCEGHYDLIILDEEQMITKRNSQNFFNGKLKYNVLLSMTGTPSRDWDKKVLYNGLCIYPICDLSINKAVNLGLLSNYQINVVNISMSQNNMVMAGSKSNRFEQSEIKNYTYLDKMVYEDGTSFFRVMARKRAIENSPSKYQALKNLYNSLEGRVLCFSPTIKIAEKLDECTYHSKTSNEDLQKFYDGKIDKISMVNSGGLGFTYKNIDHLIIAQSTKDQNGNTTQKICRTLLKQKDYKATVWILCLLGTRDEDWIASCLKRFDQTKIKHFYYDNDNKWISPS